jgi:hypothetical protein
MVHTYFDTSSHVFRANSVGEYYSDALCQVLSEQGTLANLLVLLCLPLLFPFTVGRGCFYCSLECYKAHLVTCYHL